MARRPTQTKLNANEMARFTRAAVDLHHACCMPLLAINSDDRRALTALNQAIIETFKAMGHCAPWTVAHNRMPGRE